MNIQDLKKRQRDHRAPNGSAPNWLLVLVACLTTGAAMVAGAFV